MNNKQFAKLLALFHEIEALMVKNGAKVKKSDGNPTSFSDKVKSFDNFESEPPNPGDIGHNFYFKYGTYHIKDDAYYGDDDYKYYINDKLKEYIKYKSYKKRYWEYKNNLLGGNFSRLKNIGHQRNQLLHIYNYNVRFYAKFVYECYSMIRFLKNYKKKTLFGLGKSNFEKDIDLKNKKINFIDKIRKIIYTLFINLVLMFLMVLCIKAFKLLFGLNMSTLRIFIIAGGLFWALYLSESVRGFMSKRTNRYVLVFETTLLLIATTSIFDFILDDKNEGHSIVPSSYMGESSDYNASTLAFLKKRAKEVSIPKIKDKEVIVHKIAEPIKNVSTKLLKNKRLCKYFYVQTSNLNVRAKASSKANLVGKLHLNEKLCITKKDEDWFYIDNQGWVYSKYIDKKKKLTKKKKKTIKK